MTDEHHTSSPEPGDRRAPGGIPSPRRDTGSAPRTRAERRAAEQAALEAETRWRQSPPTGALPTTRAIPTAAPGAAARREPPSIPTPVGATAWERSAPSPDTPAPDSSWRARAAVFAAALPQSRIDASAPAPEAPVPTSAPVARPDAAPAARPDVASATPSATVPPVAPPAVATTPLDEALPPRASAAPAFPTRRQISHAARHVTRLGRGNAARLLLLTVVTALAVEMIRASGPLLDRAFVSGVTVAAGTALITYAAPALAVTIIAARLPISGKVALGSVFALVGWRLGLQALGLVAGSEGPLGSARYGLGLGGVALAVATLVIVAAFVSGVRPFPDEESPERAGGWAPLANGRMVALGVALGVLGAAGVSLLYETWDAYWRTGLLAWAGPLALGGLAVISAWLLRHDTAAPGARGLWVLGPYLALGVMVFGNPAFIASQTGLPLSAAAGAVAFTALMVGLTTVRGTARSSRPEGNVVLSVLGRWADLVALVAFALVIFGLPNRTEDPETTIAWAALVCVVGLAVASTDAVVHALTRPAQEIGWLRLAGASTAVGLGLILPLLVYQLDYDVPLPVPNVFVPVAVALVIGVAGLRRTRRLPSAAAGTAAAARVAAPSVRISRPVVAAVVVVTVGGAAVASVDLTDDRATTAGAAGAEAELVVLDWNLHYGVSSTPSVELADVAETIRASGAQVVLLQEVSRGWVLGGGSDMGAYLARATDMEIAFVAAADRQFGNAILWDPAAVSVSDVSRLALPYGDGPQHRSAISATVTGRDEAGTAWVDEVRVTSVHLQHRRQNTPTRLSQLEALFAAEPVDGPRVLGGDFNAEPGWEEIELVESHGLISGQDAAGSPDDLTSPAIAPRYRIDWIFSAGLTTERFRVLDDVSSDHRPVIAVLRPAAPADNADTAPADAAPEDTAPADAAPADAVPAG